MTNPVTANAYLLGEVEALEPFGFLAVAPIGHPFHTLEVTRGEKSGLEVRVPGRPPIVPELSPEVRSALRERAFLAEDEADRTKPWARAVADADAAVALVLELWVDVFGEKPDVTFDVVHGSHKKEHEARQKLARARTRIEAIVSDLLGRPAERDADGDYVMPMQDVHVVVAPRAAIDGQVVVRVFAITNVAVDVTPELGLFLARLNFGLMFGRFALDTEHRSIWFDETLLGEKFREEELRFAIRMVAGTADAWDDRLKQMFGGATYQEVLAGRASEAPPTTKPGQGLGQYL
ncbi:MAG: YbjN domain-containing protein [Myxococcota bacterium]